MLPSVNIPIVTLPAAILSNQYSVLDRFDYYLNCKDHQCSYWINEWRPFS